MKKQFVLMLLARGLSTLLQAANLVIIARLTGLAEFGLLGIITSLAILVATIFDCGMTSFISKSAALKNTDLVARGLRLNHLSTCLLAVIAGTSVLVLVVAGKTPVWAAVLIMALVIEKKVETSLSFFVAEGNVLLPNLSVLLRRLVPFLGSGVAAIVGVDPLLPYAFCYFSVCLLNMINLDRRLVLKLGVRKSANKGHSSLLLQAWPYYVGNLSAHMRFLDTSLVAAFASVQGAALYSAASKITNPLQLVPQTLTALILPHSARLSAVEARKLVNRLCLCFLSLLLIMAPAGYWATEIVELVFGPSFSGAGIVLAVTLIGLPFMTLASPLGSVLQSQGFERYVAINGIVFSVLLVVSISALTSAWGIVGSAVAGSVVFALKCLALFIKTRTMVAKD